MNIWSWFVGFLSMPVKWRAFPYVFHTSKSGGICPRKGKTFEIYKLLTSEEQKNS